MLAVCLAFTGCGKEAPASAALEADPSLLSGTYCAELVIRDYGTVRFEMDADKAPITVTNFVNLLDNVMVGALGTEQMSGVAITNQLIFVYNLTVFGGLSGAGIFGAQYFGQHDYDGMRHTMRFKLMFTVVLSVIAVVLIAVRGDRLVLLFLDNEANAGKDISITLGYSADYIRVILWGLPAFAFVQCYASTLRETGETVVPMVASVCAIVVNLVGNYLLIFGHLGFRAMGVSGAALATVISRYVELAIVTIYTHKNADRFPFIKGMYRSMKIPAALVKRIAVTGSPLLVNEILWSVGTTFVNQNYSTRGLDVVAALNILSTALQLFNIIMIAMGNAVSILVGQKLGNGEMEEAKDVDRKLLAFTVVIHVVMGALLIACSGLIPKLYNTEPEVRTLAAGFLAVVGCVLPIHAYVHGAYFTIRSGGRTIITMLFDSGYTWLIPVILSRVLCVHTALPVATVFLIVQFSDIIKIAIAVPMLRSGFWAKNIISDIEK